MPLFSAFIALVIGASAPAVSTADLVRLRQGEVLSNLDSGHMEVSFFVPGTQRHAYDVLADVAHPAFMPPGAPAAKVLRKGPGWAEVEMSGKRVTRTVRYTFTPPGKISWRPLKAGGDPIRYAEWRIVAVPGGCVVSNVFELDLGQLNPVMKTVFRSMSKKMAGAIADGLRKSINSRP